MTSGETLVAGTRRLLAERGAGSRLAAGSPREAEKFPHDMESQRRYANELAQQNGQWSGAFAWLDRVLAERMEWHAWELGSLQSTYVDLLRQQGRYDRMVECLDGWLQEDPSDASLYERYLNALVGTDQEAKANRCVAEWLEQGRQPKRLDEAVAARLQAAVSFALGQSYAMYTNRLEDRWLTSLADTAEFFAAHATQMHVADRIMNHWRFQQTDACRRVRSTTFQRLRRETSGLPVGRLQTLVGWVIPNDPAIEAPGWRQLAKALERRWDTETDPDARQQVAAALIQVLSSRLTPEEHLRFLRRQLAEGPDRYHASHASELFDALLSQPWSQALEDEALALLSEQNDATEPVLRLLSQVAALYRLTDRMVQARYQAAMDRVAHPEQLTRSELREQQRAATAAAREGLIQRLEIAERQADEAFAPWLQLERQTLQVLAGQQLPRVAEDCWEALGPEPAELDPEANAWQTLLDAVREHRCLVTLSNLVVRRTADPADADRLLDWLDRGITRTDDPQEADIWRWHKFQLLVALDRPEMLDRQLTAWIDVSGADPFWRRALAYLRAEQGQIAAAISLLEPLEKAGELEPADYRALASWYLVADQREQHERCLIENWKMAEEWQLSQWLNQRLNPWQRSDTALPSELNPDVMRVFLALFEQSSYPQNYLWQLREFYRATRDFRLLAVLPDALLGQTAGKVYPLLTGMRSTLEEIRDEATADSVVEHVKRLRSRANTDVDHRALDLIEALVERRGSKVLNQPGPHVTRALTAAAAGFRSGMVRGRTAVDGGLAGRSGEDLTNR